MNEPDYREGYQWGWGDGTHPSGVMTRLSHRDPEAWSEQSDRFREGYNAGWEAAR